MTEAMTINNLGFTELSQVDLMGIDGGGISWEGFGEVLTLAAGAYLGAEAGRNIGVAVGGVTAGPVGAVVGGFVGTAAGYILYNLFD